MRTLLLVLTLILFAPAIGLAADTGSVSGVVFDSSGAVVPDAIVRIAGDGLPVGRTTQTGANGSYQFDYLLPGAFTVDVEKSGIGMARRPAIVEVGKNTPVDLVIGVSVTESITVTAAMPIVDRRSSEVSFNVTADTFNALPLERTYRGLFQLMPGVADNRSSLGPSAGGGRQDNTYLIDGTNITNPGYGYLSVEVNELDIAEVNLKRAGVSAEFGRSSGSVSNAVSRSGSNRFAGLGRIDWLSEHLVNAYRLPGELLDLGLKPGAFRDPQLTSEIAPALGLGGPVLRDRVFFYGSVRYSLQTKWDRINKVGTDLPNEVRTSQEYYGKLTAVPTGSHQVNVGYRYRPGEADDYGLDSNTAPSAATDTDNTSRIASAEWANFMTGHRALNVRYLYYKEKNEDVPVTDLGYLPAFRPTALATMGQYNDPRQADLRVGGNQFTNIQNYRRHEVRASLSQFFDLGRTTHALKAGVGYEFGEEHLARLVNGWGLITNVTLNGVPAIRTRYYTRQAPQLGQGRTSSVFAQDDVTLANRATLNLGVLLNRDAFAQEVDGRGGCPAVLLTGGAAVYESKHDRCTFLRFSFLDEVQPRLGVSYQLREGKDDKAYANWGRYYNMDQKSAARSLAPVRIFQTQTDFDLEGRVLASDPLASTTGKIIDPDIKPIHNDELVVGYATPFGSGYSLDVFFMYRTMKDFIEDVPSRLNGTAPNSGPFVASNLPCTRFAACQGVDAKRTYRAMTIDVRRRLLNGLMTDVSYTWSRYEGNFDLDYSNSPVFNTSSFIQDGPGTNVQDPNRFGPLLEDRPHVFKVFTAYNATERLSLSAYLRMQSGSPWTPRARDWAGAMMNYLEPAGSHRNPAWSNLDLMTVYRLPVGGRARMSLEARLLNVFNNQTRISTDSVQFLDLRTVPTAPFFAPYLQGNPFFGTGNGFAPPRRLHLAASFTF